MSHTAGQVKALIFLLINPHVIIHPSTGWGGGGGGVQPETFPLWGASINRCAICENNLGNYSELLEIFKGGEQLGENEKLEASLPTRFGRLR